MSRTGLTAEVAPKALAEFGSNLLVQAFALVSVTLFGAALRLYKLGQWSFWIDEAYTVERSQVHGLLSRTPVSLRLIRASMDLLGSSDWSARIAPAIIGILTIPVLYFLARRLFDSVIALLSAFLLALSPWHLFWSQNTRFYSAQLLFYLLALFAAYLWLERDQLRWLILSFVMLTLAVLERMTALFYGPVIAAYFAALFALPFERPAGLRLRNFVLFLIPPLAMGVFLLTLTAETLSSEFIAYTRNPVRVLLSVISDLGLPLFLFGLAGSVYLIMERRRVGLFLSLGAVVPLVLLVLMAPFTKVESRYIFFVLPNWIMLGAVAGEVLWRETPRRVRILALGAALLLVAGPVSQDVLYYTQQNGNREDWKSAFRQVSREMRPGDLVLTTNPEMGWHYLNPAVGSTREVLPDAVKAHEGRVWFVIDDRAGNLFQNYRQWIVRNAQLVGVYDVTIPGRTMTMRVYLYDPMRPPQFVAP